MKKKTMRTILVIVIFISAISLSLLAFLPVEEPDMAAFDEKIQSENVIVCRCSNSFLSNSKCKVTNEGYICAISEPYGNINCGEYKSNCSLFKKISRALSRRKE